jgi:peptide/nickel transport system substrate-binding protein
MSDERPGQRIDTPDDGPVDGLTRRRLLGTAAQGALAFGAAGALASCDSGTSSSDTEESTTGSATPSRGGTLTVGLIGAGAAEQLAPSTDGDADACRSASLYDRLFDTADDLRTLVPRLALSAEPNSDGTVWTLKLRDGVVWHNGKPFTADDVVYTMQSWQSPKSHLRGLFDDIIDFKRVRKRDRLTVEVPLVAPYGQFDTLLATHPSRGMTPAGMTFEQLAKQPIGTGPFKFESFHPGRQSTFVANKDYWREGGPYVDRLVINTSFSEPTALYNALLGGDIDVLGVLPLAYAPQAERSNEVQLLRARQTAAAQYFYMDVTKPPFNDVRVRQAMKLLVDRSQFVQNALSGYGDISSNDLFGRGCEYFADDLKRSQDIDEAKSLLKAAGQEDLSVTLIAAPIAEGSVQAATLFANQAKSAGVNVRVRNIPAANLFNSAAGYPYPFSAAYYWAFPSLTVWYLINFIYYAETSWDIKADSTIQAALRAVDPSEADARWQDVQLKQFNEGPHLIWGHRDILDTASMKVRGLETSGVGPLRYWAGLVDAWVERS